MALASRERIVEGVRALRAADADGNGVAFPGDGADDLQVTFMERLEATYDQGVEGVLSHSTTAIDKRMALFKPF
jgi:hypothetical protein